MNVNEAEADKLYDRLRAKMDQHGWAVLTVASTDGRQPGFAYSVGIAKWGHPEVVVYGLPPDIAQGVINSVGRRIVHGETFPVNSVITGAFDNDQPITVKGLPLQHSLVVAKAAHRFFDSPAFTVEVVQLVWADTEGRYPWDGGSDAVDRQPLAAQQGELPFL